MNFISHPTNNLVMKAPEGATNVDDLPVTIAKLSDGSQAIVSFWKPDAEELAALNAGKPVMLYILSPQHPVVSLGVEAIESQQVAH